MKLHYLRLLNQWLPAALRVKRNLSTKDTLSILVIFGFYIYAFFNLQETLYSKKIE